ncbi:chemotaxis protein CheY [Shewanella mangrovi]|uniref:Chemotaxis protein CheY n=1 Tax=Shewanella mangrovi TaxID=1515746 RepID=A0A094LVA0_9GAMM|nr:two-component system response regulator [Shewanella mangrovi]KFZ39158.1 chemotaxis protein CheY [Shewanella mangrovi]
MSDSRQNERFTLLLVDDEPINLQVLRHSLQEQYRLLFAKDGVAALSLAANERPDLILLDIMMPGISGYEVCEALKRSPDTEDIPVIFVSAMADAKDEFRGLELGAVDYITKPFHPQIVQARVKTHLSLVRAKDVQRTRLQIVQCLGAAAEYKDNETGLHVVRMSHFSRLLALELGYSEEKADDILHASAMHDVGKIGIPDAILQKPGKLDDDEWQVMRTHPQIGAKIIGEHENGLLQLAAIVALNHHEKWDGSGYPRGLVGEDIPEIARIVAVADVFDALTSVRPYKPAWPIADALAHMQAQSGKHFDPNIIAAFMRCLPQVEEVRQRWADENVAI